MAQELSAADVSKSVLPLSDLTVFSDQESCRYALCCIQICGDQLFVTDGRILINIKLDESFTDEDKPVLLDGFELKQAYVMMTAIKNACIEEDSTDCEDCNAHCVTSHRRLSLVLHREQSCYFVKCEEHFGRSHQVERFRLPLRKNDGKYPPVKNLLDRKNSRVFTFELNAEYLKRLAEFAIDSSERCLVAIQFHCDIDENGIGGGLHIESNGLGQFSFKGILMPTTKYAEKPVKLTEAVNHGS